MLYNAFSTILLLLEVLSRATARSRRRCRNSSLAIENIQIKFYQKQSTKILADGNITRYLTINWTLHGANTSQFDGYLIRMRDASIARSSMAPFGDLDASLTKLWIRTKNVTECSNSNETKNLNIDDSMTSSEVYCWCNESSCFILDKLRCLPTTSLLRSRLGAFYAIPNTKTSIMYATKYRTQYSMEFYPYYRQFLPRTSKRLFSEPTWSCVEDLSDILNISVAEANRKCCEKDLAAFSPLEVRKSDFVFDPVTMTLNISISWIPPVMAGFSGSSIRVYPGSQVEQSNRPQFTTIESEGSYNENISCQIHNRTESVTIYNLQPNMTYTINIHGWHSSVAGKAACRSTGCTKRLEINTNLCDSDNSKCSDYAYCEYDTATFTATCECKPGFTGNGISTKYNTGTGCEPVASSPSPFQQQT